MNNTESQKKAIHAKMGKKLKVRSEPTTGWMKGGSETRIVPIRLNGAKEARYRFKSSKDGQMKG